MSDNIALLVSTCACMYIASVPGRFVFNRTKLKHVGGLALFRDNEAGNSASICDVFSAGHLSSSHK